MKKRISAFFLSSLLCLCQLSAQTGTAKTAVKNAVKKTAEPAFFQGMALNVEVASPVLYALGADVLNTEAGLRLNFRNHYFPLAELGYSKYESTHDDTQIHYETAAPYLRVGVDVNMLKDKLQENRLMVGARLGYTNYQFDVDGPSMVDPIWGDSQPLDLQGISSNRLWLEMVFSLESEILRHFHMGFSIRYKKKLHEKTPVNAVPYYVPGFGNGDDGFRATYNLFFDLTRKVKAKETKK